MILRGLQWLAWLAYLAGCLLILNNSIQDYLPGGLGLFISDKGEIGRSALWRGSLYVHIVGGLICLFAALPQFSKSLLRHRPSIHRIAGRLFGMSMLVLVSPTGFHLALHAKGGFLGKLGFLTLAVAGFHATLAGWRAVLPRHRDLEAHRDWMTRSFALAASAVTFRVYHTLGYLAGVEAESSYVVCLWLSLLGNLAVAELILHRRKAAPFLLQPQIEP